jgi:hypothetical protein
LANDYNKGRDFYPSSFVEAYELMLHDVRGEAMRAPPQGGYGVAFNTIGNGQVIGTKAQPKTRPEITCNECHRSGHFANRCAEVVALDGTVLAITSDGSNDNNTASATDAQAETGTPHTTIEFEAFGFQFLTNAGQIERLEDGVVQG